MRTASPPLSAVPVPTKAPRPSTASSWAPTATREPGWAVPTYSPRLIPVSFCQWFLYIELILIDRAFRTTRIGPSILAGAGAGISFLAHAAPALISVLIIFLFTMRLFVRGLSAGAIKG